MPPTTYLFIGLGIGLATSAPVGPVNIAAIQATFRYGFHAGLLAGSGAVVADALYAALAAFGITAVADFVTGHEHLIQLAGGILVILFGVKVFTAHPHIDPRKEAGVPHGLHGMVSGFLMTLTNPGVVLGFLAIFGSLGEWAPETGDFAGAGALVAGVVAGALLWWTLLAAAVAKLRERLDDHWLERINHTAGVLLILFGAGILALLAYDRLIA